MFATLNNQDKSAFIVFDSSLKMFTGVYRVIKGFFCNICGEKFYDNYRISPQSLNITGFSPQILQKNPLITL